MNILHLKYAVEIERTRSISKAAENLFMAQPNLSRAMKELEESLGITIFNRTSKGITVTPDGEEFLQYARRIIAQVDEVEAIYKNGKQPKQSFSVCVPRASYAAAAFTEFAKRIRTDTPAEIYYKETGSMHAVDAIVNETCNLGVIRYQTAFERYFRNLFLEKKLNFEVIADFSYVLLLSETHPLAKKEEIMLADLEDSIEICHADPYVPSMPTLDAKKAELSEFVDKRIYVYERGSQFDLLEKVPSTFMWVSPVPDELLRQHHLVMKNCSENVKVYRDVLIYRKNYKLSELDKAFITDLCDAKRKYLK